MFQRRVESTGESVAPYLLADGGYPNLPWLITVFPGHDTDLSTSQRRFNFAHSSARTVIERAFGRLKGRWRILMSKLRHKVEFVPAIIMCCVTLHNWLILKLISFWMPMMMMWMIQKSEVL